MVALYPVVKLDAKETYQVFSAILERSRLTFVEALQLSIEWFWLLIQQLVESSDLLTQPLLVL